MTGGETASVGLAWFNELAGAEAAGRLYEVCASRAWARALLSGRPYADVDGLLAASDRAMAGLDDGELTEAVAGHPPIGRPRPGDPVSAREQSGVAASQREELLELNLRYQDTFGHVFLICATGRTGEEMLAALKQRLGNPPERERGIVRTELAAINRIRLRRLVTTTVERETDRPVSDGGSASDGDGGSTSDIDAEGSHP